MSKILVVDFTMRRVAPEGTEEGNEQSMRDVKFWNKVKRKVTNDRVKDNAVLVKSLKGKE